MTQTQYCELDQGRYDETYDVIVAGYGFAGGIAAIEAARHGARVLICEKMPQAGGISICSGGAVRCASNGDDAFAYLKATNAGTTPDDVLRVLADGMAGAEAYVRALVADVPGASIKPMADKKGANYPFPGWESFYSTLVQAPSSLDQRKRFPGVSTKPSSGAPSMFYVIDHHLKALGIEVRLETPVTRLIRSPHNEVHGVVAGARRIAARRGVILACGGFEADEAMKRQYWEGKPILTASTRGNTGDGIRMAQALGADLWHMWHFHGCYAFRHPDPDFPFALRVKRLPDWNPLKKNDANVKMAWIVVDQRGRRYMNESPPYCQDTAHRPMHRFDPETMSYPRIPSWLITDESGRDLYPLGDIRSNDGDYSYEWSADNRKEIELGILQQADTIAELAARIGTDTATLAATLARWNALCNAGSDADFGRPGGTMMRIDTPPYLFGAVYPAVSNTQGGPVHDPRQRILDPAGAPIARLYAAGELGSSFGHLYVSGGNIAECFVTGWVAGREAAALTSWDAAPAGKIKAATH
jgi:succinate dehydrogenase/fumarate reductase flavoprotein subunit